ncbi:Uncharacterised protein [Mycobacteroides abscessus subsp. abscessus]|nr:Uncharacterised protein [Mycobacteroides abscessus subsp. abscessus]
MRTVRSRVLPPAPYVSDTNAGLSRSKTRTARHRRASPSASFGGRNSTEKGTCPGCGADRRSTTDGTGADEFTGPVYGLACDT